MSRRILLTQDQFAIVDDKKYNWLSQWKWCAHWNKDTQSFYAMRNSKCVNGKRSLISMARGILGLKKGDKRQADHRNHKTLDNREKNLRIVTNQQNSFNPKKLKGYHWDKTKRKYHAEICLNAKTIHLGYFFTAKEAHAAYLKAKKEYHKIGSLR